jgi:hypothetical protein
MNTHRFGRLTAAPVLSILLCCAPGKSRAASPDQNAHFLAGLSVQDAALQEFSKKPFFNEHASAFRSAWASFQSRQINPIHAWQKEFLPTAEPKPRPLVYLFSGPDILHAYSFFPDAPTYVLCGIEPVGNVPELEKMEPSKIGPALQGMRQSLESVLNWSFFKTKNMKTDLTATPLQGTLPILSLFLARMDCTIQSVNWVSVDRSGTLTPDKVAGSLAPGVCIEFTRAGRTERQTLYYFSSDLSDGEVQKTGLLKWCESLGAFDTFLKSASYLMHTSGFQTCRKFLLENSERLLQDDSGIPLKHFAETQWDLTPFGHFIGPITLFKDFPQADLSALHGKHRSKPLPFAFGYQWRPNQSSILLAKRKATTAPSQPVSAPGQP